MIAAESDELRPAFAERAYRVSPAKVSERLCHLLGRDIVVKRRDGNVSAINDFRPVLVGIDVCARVECAERRLTRRGLSYGSGAKSGACKR